jgi:hypothetical protein
MADFECTIDGLDQLGDRFNVDKLRAAVKQEVYFFALEVLQASKEVCPMDTGALVNSGQVGRHTAPGVMPMEMAYDTEDGAGVAVDVGYGDTATDYALAVHENLEPGVNWTRPGSGPKFLENPLKERQDQLPGRCAEAIRKAFGVA